MKLLIPALMLIAALPSLRANAQSINYLSCDNCSYAEKKSLAVLSGRNGKVNVIDFKAIEAKSFYVFNEPGEHSALPANSSQELKNNIEVLKDYKKELEIIATGNIPINALTPYMYHGSNFNVVDLAKSKSTRADVAQAIGKYYENNVAASVRTIASAFGVTAINSVITSQYVLTVEFGSNGDTFQYKFSSLLIYPNGTVGYEFTAVEGSGRSVGVMIVATGSGGFEIRGSTESVEAFINRLGFTVTGGYGNSGSVTIGCEGSTGHPCIKQD